MTALILPRRFTQQPQEPVEVDTGNPIFNQSVSIGYSIGSVIFNATEKRIITASNVGVPYTGSLGVAPIVAAGSPLVLSNAYAWNSRGPQSLWIRGYYNNAYGSTNVITRAPSNYNGYHGIACGTGDIDKNYVIEGSLDVDGPAIVGGVVSLLNDVAVYDGTSVVVYSFGEVSFGGAATGTANTTPASIQIGYHRFGANEWVSPVAFGAWNRALTAAEVFELSHNPWQIFKPRRKVLYFSTGSVPIPTLSSPGVTNILTTSATPQVTLTF